MATLTTNPRRLRKHLDRLRQRPRREWTADDVEAMAEASFRLAVHEDTAADEAIRLLQQAHRLDGANPKHAYHLGRLFHSLGRFERAGKWLETALRNCPTSHRLWTHVSLLQFDLNARYHGQHEYEPDDLRRCASDIAGAVRGGCDRLPADRLRFKPRPSTTAGGSSPAPPDKMAAEDEDNRTDGARRYTRAGTCRWSGVNDLAGEQACEGAPTKRTLNEALPCLVFAAHNALVRPGGVGGFVILAVQWLVSGYPVEPVRFLRRTVAPSLERPSLAVLDLVCELMETPADGLPARLGAALAAAELPPVLAALIHRRRLLLPQPTELRAAGKYRRARKLLADCKQAADPEAVAALEQEARELSKSLQQAARAYDIREPRQLEPPAEYVLTDAPADPAGDLAAICTAATTLRRLHRDLLAAAEKAGAANDIEDLWTRFRDGAETACQRLDVLLANTFDMSDDALPDGSRDRAARCRPVLHRCRYDTVVPQRLAAKRDRDDGDDDDGTPPDAAPDTGAIAAALDDLFPADSGPSRDLAAELENIETAAAAMVAAKQDAFRFLKQEVEPGTRDGADDAARTQALVDSAAFGKLITAWQEAAERGSRQLDDLVVAVAAGGAPDAIADLAARSEECRRQLRDLGNLGNFQKILRRIAKRLAGVPAADAAPGNELRTWLETATAACTGTAAPAAAPTAPADRVAAIAADAEALNAEFDDHWIALKKLEKQHTGDGLDDAARDRGAAIVRFIGETAARTGQMIEDLQSMRASGEITDPEQLATLDAAEQRARTLATRPGVFQRKLRRLPDFDETPPAATTPAATGDTPVPPPRPDEPAPALRYDMQILDRRIEDVFDRLKGTFAPYGSLCRFPALEALYLAVLARHAEALSGLGQLRHARRLWNQMLTHDRLNVAALHNIAVCDSLTRRVGRALASWRACAEAMYVPPVIRGEARHGAGGRTHFHHQFGGAYAPALLSQPLTAKDRQKLDPLALTAFLKSRARVRLFVHHKLLAFLDAKLDFSSPPVLLGTGRSAGENARERACKGLVEFTRRVQPLLPGRIRDAFADTAQQSFETALETCRSASKLTLENDPRYAEEMDRQEQWVKDVCHLKFRIWQALMDNSDAVVDLGTLAFFPDLLPLDDIPIDQQPTFLQAVGAQLRVPEADMLQSMMQMLCEQFCGRIANRAENTDCARLIPAFIELVERLDRVPTIVHLLMKLLLQAARAGQDDIPVAAAAEAVGRWLRQAGKRSDEHGQPQADDIDKVADQFDECLVQIVLVPFGKLGDETDWAAVAEAVTTMLGIAPDNGSLYYWRMIARHRQANDARQAHERSLAQQCIELATADAERVLELCTDEDKCEQARKLTGQVGTFRRSTGADAANEGNFDEALDTWLPMLREDDADADLARQVMAAFVQDARARKEADRHREMVAAIDDWLARVRDDPISDVTAEDADDVENDLDEHLALLFLAPVGALSDETDWDAVAHEIQQLTGEYPQNRTAHYYRMLSLQRQANAIAEAGDVTRARGLLADAAEAAEQVIEATRNDDHREQAVQLRDKIREILG